jgi:hypothetical protein
MSAEPSYNHSNTELDATAHEDFDRAHFKAFWNAMLSLLTQQSNSLLPFDEVRKRLDIKGQHYAGLQQVPIERIVGSVNRYHDFDRAFLPRVTYTRDRWESIDKAHLRDEMLPPVELYKIGEIYFVKDGNHRVSVGREKGQAFIDAEVIELETNVPISRETDLNDLILAQEKAHFYETTKLNEKYPDCDIDLTLPGQFGRLLEHINVHRWYLGEQRGGEVPFEEAASSWFERVYQPLVHIIREGNILREFPGRTEADLYLWIIEHRQYLMEAYKDEVSLEEAAKHFAQEFSQRPLARLKRLLRRAVGAITADGHQKAEE